MTWSVLPVKYALRETSPGHVSIKGAASHDAGEGLLPGYSASGQDVWLQADQAQFRGRGLVLSAVGARCGKVFLAEAAAWGVVANTAVLMPQPGHDPRYLWYLVNDESFWDKGGAAQPYIRIATTLDRRRAFPPLDEQRRIADFLDAETARIDRLTDLRDQQHELLGARRWAFVRHSVAELDCRRRKPVSLGWVDDLPSAWQLVPLKSVARYGSGHTPSRTHPEYWTDCQIPWISLFDVGRMRDPTTESIYETTQKISELGIANSSACVHPASTVVLSRTASVGFATIMGTPMAVSQHFATWTCGPRLLPKYLLYVLRAMKQTWESLQVGTTNVTVFMPDLLALRIPLPLIEEQRQIVSAITGVTTWIDGLATCLDRQRHLLVERRRALITAAVTGQLDVTTARGAVS